ncbi:MAG TPA: SsrA-binding protein SmpB [Bacteroidales bacterium]|jgi:SsrA-binding protein|nr:SsrA-binding protein SmpB [Bacteroidales bacterium]MDI9554080.1 SsrA-binding protein SmpB [Bacteroidota bacterium]MBP7038357.1 SsrA-binding protein SmpB [Bacteroidales bacterium]MZP66402.1 SsrA-binding protein SmpB [Bacteroidales bacterium]HNY52139.1 SsrA-binding protein SmpB [Bacteroidales bacterium]
MRSAGSNIVIKNKKASHDYVFLEKFIAGIKLTGTEIKSIRAGKAALTDAFCQFTNGELYLKGMHISEYWWGNLNNHDPLRERKLLLTRRELRKLERKVKETGLTIIAIKVFINDRGLAKAEIALARGKKEYDKRETLKRRDADRELDRIRKK